MTFTNQKGTVLTFVVIGIGLIAALSAGALYLTSTASLSGLSANDQNQAYHLAKAGIEYALTNNLSKASTFTLKEGKFSLTFSVDKIESTGIVREGTPYEVKRKIVVEQKGFGSRSDITGMSEVGIKQPATAPSPSDFISKTATSLSLGKIGPATDNPYKERFGSVIYSGNAVQGNCTAGECEFGKGFNLFFVFQYAYGSTGDGFTFAFFNGDNNTATSVGGWKGRGELMGYAGNSRTTSGTCLDNNFCTGIQPPKIAVEFDPYANTCSAALCSGSDPPDGISCDPTDADASHNNKNHMALVFWGDNTCAYGTTAGKYTFDDNRHCNGGTGNETFFNASFPSQPSPCSNAYEKCYYFDGTTACTVSPFSRAGNWLLDTSLPNIYAFRIEVSRNLTAETSGNYKYRIKAWIKPCTSSTCDTYPDGGNYTNTKVDYTDDDPTIDRIIEMSSQYHEKFKTLFLGWTTATGGATQEVNINRFRMNFRK